jgi:hypothetical protein
MNKKGIAISFNWIFILVAGAIILLVSMTFLFQYVQFSKDRTRIKTLNELDIAFSDLKTIEGLFVKPVTFQKEKTLKTGCGYIELDGKKVVSEHIIYSPGEIKSKTMLIGHTKIEPGVDVYYITNPNQPPVYDSKDGTVIDEKFEDLVKESGFGVGVDSLGLEFNDGVVNYISEEELVGGIILNSKEGFECRQKKIFEQMEEQIRILEMKSKFLQRELLDCGYTPLVSSLSRLREASSNGDALNFKSEYLSFEAMELGGCPDVK